jgi:hypothetical protein
MHFTLSYFNILLRRFIAVRALTQCCKAVHGSDWKKVAKSKREKSLINTPENLGSGDLQHCQPASQPARRTQRERNVWRTSTDANDKDLTEESKKVHQKTRV